MSYTVVKLTDFKFNFQGIQHNGQNFQIVLKNYHNVCHKLHYIKTFMQILVLTNFYWRIVSKFSYLEYKKIS